MRCIVNGDTLVPNIEEFHKRIVILLGSTTRKHYEIRSPGSCAHFCRAAKEADDKCIFATKNRRTCLGLVWPPSRWAHKFKITGLTRDHLGAIRAYSGSLRLTKAD